MQGSLLKVTQLRVQIQTKHGIVRAVDGLDFTLHRGEIFALVGESGCGKSMTALAINRLLPDNAHICAGSEILLDGIPLHQLSEDEMRKVRGKKIGMIFQDPALALNPVLSVRDQLKEALCGNQACAKSSLQIESEMIELLEKVRIPTPVTFLNQYPHQLSGGMKQRLVIAMALAQNPILLIADEATTALDVTTQAQVLKLIKELNQQLKMAILLITHDLAIVAQMANTVAVMYAGHIVEKTTTTEFVNAPKHPYTKQLFAALPEITASDHALAVIPGMVPSLNQNFTLCRFKDRCRYIFKPCEQTAPALTTLTPMTEVRCHWYEGTSALSIPDLVLSGKKEIAAPEEEEEEALPPIELQVNNLKVYFPITAGFFKKTVGYIKAVDGVHFNIYEGKTLALVGESGSGKTTVAKAVLRLIEAQEGQIIFQNKDLRHLSKRKMRPYRALYQMIFQDPYSAMDPRFRVNDIVLEGMLALKIGTDAAERQHRIDLLLEQVGLSLDLKNRYPHELSGGQRQRVAIARALAVGAQLLICDEPTSALDVSVQAQILNLLRSLQSDLGISLLFITHNIGVVRYLADDLAVMHQGQIVEYGPAKKILTHPQHPYTQTLLAAVPTLKLDENSTQSLKIATEC